MTEDWFADLANWRRGGDDFDILWEEGRASVNEKRIMDALAACPSMNARELKRAAGFERSSAFDAAIARLQAQCYVTIVDFDYDYDRFGQRRGWAVSRYATVENRFGDAFADRIYEKEPLESYERMLTHLTGLLGAEYEKQIRRLLA